MPTASPKSEWLSPPFLLAVLVTVSAGVDKFNTYNGTAQTEIAVLKTRVDQLVRDMARLEGRVR